MKFLVLLLLFLSLSAQAEKMQDFTLPIFKENKNFVLSENLKDKKILINFWASWCTSCIQELPLLDALKEKYGDKVVFVAINAGEKSNLITKFLKKYKFNFIHLEDQDRVLSKKLKVDSLPVTIVVDKDMNIIYREVVPPKEL